MAAITIWQIYIHCLLCTTMPSALQAEEATQAKKSQKWKPQPLSRAVYRGWVRGWLEVRLEKEPGASQLMGGLPIGLGSLDFVYLWGNGDLLRGFRPRSPHTWWDLHFRKMTLSVAEWILGERRSLWMSESHWGGQCCGRPGHRCNGDEEKQAD